MNDTEKETRIKRLVYRANHRGIKEMDIILGRFANERLAGLEPALVEEFENLLNEHDRDLLAWFTGEAPFPHDEMRTVFRQIEAHILETSGND